MSALTSLACPSSCRRSAYIQSLLTLPRGRNLFEVLSEAIVAILLPTRHTLIKVRLASIAPVHGVKKRLRKLASLVDIYVLTSDTRGTAKIEPQRIPLYRIIVEARKHDVEKRNYLRKSLGRVDKFDPVMRGCEI